MNTKPKLINIASILAKPEAIKNATHKVPVMFDKDGNAVAGFVIVGRNSNEHAGLAKSIRIENITRGANRTAPIDTKTEDGATTVVDALTLNEHRTAVAIIVDWYGFGDDEKELPFDKTQVAELLSTFPVWQALVLQALDVDANFMKI